MSTNPPTVSVIIPAKDAAGTLPRALESVTEQSYPNIVEVIVAAADEASEQAATGATVVRNPGGSTPAGLNLAIGASTGEVIVRCDAHSILPHDYVAHAVETLERTGAANVGGRQVPAGETRWEKAIATAMSSPFGAGDARYRIGGEEGPVETVYLGVFRRTALEVVGGFDETFTRNQDYELNHRLIESGAVVWFDPALEVSYRPRGSLFEVARQYYRYGASKRLFVRKHRRGLRWRQLAPPALVLTLVASLLLSIWYPLTLLAALAYAFLLIAAAARSPGSVFRVALVLATMHLSWGIGFLVGRSQPEISD